MKNFFISLLIIALIQCSSYAQSGWFPLQCGVNSDFYSLYFTSASTGYVVGNYYIIKTTNSGLNWFTQVYDLSMRLRSVVFINSNTGIVVGRDGLILKTTNGGSNWIPKNSGNVNDLTELFMYDNNHGFISGGFETFLRTTDCGESWSGYSLGEQYHLYSVNVPTSSLGWCVGDEESSRLQI